MMDGAAHAVLAFAPHSLTLYPTRSYIHCAQSIEVKSLDAFTTVGQQVHLQETRTFLIPVSKSSDGDLDLEQAPRLGGAEGAALTPLPIRLEPPINGGRTQLAELVSYFTFQREFSMPLQHPHQFR